MKSGLLGPSGPLAVVVEAYRPGGDAVAELGRFPKAHSASPVDQHDNPLLLSGNHRRERLETRARPRNATHSRCRNPQTSRSRRTAMPR